jgi:hypothetical protein
LTAFALPRPRHFASDLCAAAWRARAGALLEEIADGIRPAGRQRARSCPGARATDIEELIQLTCRGTFARSPNAWLAARSHARAARRASSNTRTAATASPKAAPTITHTSSATANCRATAADSAAANRATTADSAAATAAAPATTAAAADQVARQEQGCGRYHCDHHY